MVSPYREAHPLEFDREAKEDAPLATYSVSGRAGAKGMDGAHGLSGTSYGEHGRPGADASAAEAGQNAGTIRVVLEERDGMIALRGEAVDADGCRSAISESLVAVGNGLIELRACGGRGGDGGAGGNGGAGTRGRPGSDATSVSVGGNGGPGGNGATGGNGSSGAVGGRGGTVVVEVSDADTPLLMLVDPVVDGGKGGSCGRNGSGGAGGDGGVGGSSYSWSESETYTDSNGNTQTHVNSRWNPGGSQGRSGRRGADGHGQLAAGARGEDGTYQICVRTDSVTHWYSSRYDLRLVGFAHDSLNEDGVYEPGEIVRVFDLVVENIGGMPTPAKDDLFLSIVRGGWVIPETGDLACPPGLEPNRPHAISGELKFRIKEHEATLPGDPLEVVEQIVHRALLPSVQRVFANYQVDAVQHGRFVIRYPVRLSPVASLRSLAPGQGTRVKFSVTNQSQLPLGSASATKRCLRVRITTAPDSELGDEHVRFLVDGVEATPSEGYAREISVLDPGDDESIEIVLQVRDGAPEYRRYAGSIVLELGRVDEPARPKPIQMRAFDVRVARPFRATNVDMLLVVNHRTTREQIAAWEKTANDLGARLATWDLSLERHLDLEAPVANGKSLATVLSGGVLVILDNEMHVKDAIARPRDFLCPHQLLRAARTGTDVAVFGGQLAVDHLLVPTDDGPDTVVDEYKRFWVRFWAQPKPAELARRAFALSKRLTGEYPNERHVVVYRFEPTIVSHVWKRRWRLGAIETRRTLDSTQGTIVHVDVADAALQTTFASSSDATTALVLAFDFESKLRRLHELAEKTPDAVMLKRYIDVVLCDLAGEIATVLVKPWRTSRATLSLVMPRLAALSQSQMRAEPGSPLASALLQLCGRLVFLATSQGSWIARMTPLRWLRRTSAVAALVKERVDEFVTIAFGAHNRESAKAEIRAIVKSLRQEHASYRVGGYGPDRGGWARAQLRAPIAAAHITSDVEQLETADKRVLSESEYEAIASAKREQRAQRDRLVDDGAQSHANLQVDMHSR